MCDVKLRDALPSAAAQTASSPSDVIASIRQGTTQMLGVTLAGWLVLEQDTVPALWAGVSGQPVGEAALMQAAAAQASDQAVTEQVVSE